MIDRVTRALWRAQRVTSRSAWTARLVPLSGVDARRARRGLVVVQIDGLSSRVLNDAVAGGAMPVVRRLIDERGYRVVPIYSGLPASTPAAQAEFFYGVPMAVPAFAFVDRETGRLMRMSQHDAAAGVERRLSTERSLVEGGSSYCNVYTGQAAETRFCMASLEWTDPFRTRRPLAGPAVVALHAGDVVRAAIFAGGELVTAIVGLGVAVVRGEDALHELKFAATRFVIAVVMRELIALSALIDIGRGVPVVYANLIGYDESAHRRGPDASVTRHALRGIDGVIARLVRAAHRSGRPAYDVWVVSDHGQEETLPYVELHGRWVSEAVADVFRAHGMESQDAREPEHGHQHQNARAIGQRVAGLFSPTDAFGSEHWEPGRVVVTAQGPLGHVYAPRPLSPDERDVIATALVRDAGVPLVVAADGDGRAQAWTAAGTATLPDDAGAILGVDHPYRDAVADDLVALCRHPDAGDLVISGWQLAEPRLSFPHENGSHAGPGPGETDAFALVPPDAPLAPSTNGPLRPADVRRAALAVRDDAPEREASAPRDAKTIRLVTYNVHSCIGVDGTLSPERVAAVIARHEPDVVGLQELDVARARTGGVDQARLIADRLEMLLHFHPTLQVGEERYGDAVLSRLPMNVVKAAALPRLPRHPGLEPRGALWAEITTPSGPLHVVNTHLSLHPVEGRLQAGALLGPEWLGGIEPGRAVLCGDLNATPWFPVCRRLSRRMRDVQSGRSGFRPRATWPGPAPFSRIDHVFVDPAIRVTAVEVADDAVARVASDHLPLVVDLTFD